MGDLAAGKVIHGSDIEHHFCKSATSVTSVHWPCNTGYPVHPPGSITSTHTNISFVYLTLT